VAGLSDGVLLNVITDAARPVNPIVKMTTPSPKPTVPSFSGVSAIKMMQISEKVFPVAKEILCVLLHLDLSKSVSRDTTSRGNNKNISPSATIRIRNRIQPL